MSVQALIAIMAVVFVGYVAVWLFLRHIDRSVEDAARSQFSHPMEARYQQLYIVANCRRRRVAGYVQQWPDLFEQELLEEDAPRTVQEKAGRMVDDYRKGLDFSAIDKEALKQTVRDALEQTVRDALVLTRGTQ